MLRRTTDRPKVARIGQIGLLEGAHYVDQSMCVGLSEVRTDAY
jgi:hypothetical protein